MGCPFSFGELNIPSSRAFWDDCDEDDPEGKTVERLKLTYEAGQENTLTDANVLLLIEGLHISDFAEKTLLQNAEKICAIPAKKSALYGVKSKNLLLAILEQDLVDSGEVTELLLSYAAKAKNVITLTIKPKVEYKTENMREVRDKITFLRGVNSKLAHIKELEAPNFVEGVSAGIASWRENQNLPVYSYIAYTDKVPLDSLAAQPILKLLRDIDIDCSSMYTPKLRQISNLYM